jgi:cobalt/nickel transport system permease protein
MKNHIRQLYALEELAGGDTVIHRLHPTAKLLATAAFIVAVMSFGRYEFLRLAPYVFYPVLLMALSGTPTLLLAKRVLFALPFCLFAGVTNLLLDRAAAFTLGGVTVSYGALSLTTILLRTYLCVMAVLVLVAVTPLSEVTHSMRHLRVPGIFVTMFEMTYRYLGVLFEEAYSMHTAYALRSGGVKGIALKDMGSFVGQLLLRSIDRADRVYSAMKLRGYGLHSIPHSHRKFKRGDALFCAITFVFCAAFRLL